MKAYLKNYRQSPRKVRLVAGLIRGKSVDVAESSLDFIPKRASTPIRKLLDSAVANAKAQGVEKENLIVGEIMVDKGVTMKRMMPRAMGRGHRINKRTSHIMLVLKEKVVAVKTAKKEKKVSIKEASTKAKVKVVKKAK